MKPLLVFLICSVPFAASLAQTTSPSNIRDYSIIPPSPEVSSLISYSIPEVDHSTGVPYISLPVFTVRQGSLSLPISITYQAGGVKVNQETSTVGLSWRLECSAAIGRTVMGKPDEANRPNLRGLMHISANSNNFRNYLLNNPAEHNPFDINYLLGEYEPTSILATEYYEGKADLANDIFELAGCGLNATFIYDYTNGVPKATISSRNGIKIEGSPISQSYIAFDTNGIQYTFAEKEYAKFTNLYGSPQLSQQEDSVRYVSAWHLSRISNTAGDTIFLEYIERPQRTHYSGSTTINYASDYRVEAIPSRINACKSTIYYPKVLSSIRTKSHIVRFVYRPQESSDILDRIELYANDASDSIMRTLKFKYDLAARYAVGEFITQRCLLSSIMDSGEKIYEFDYYPESEQNEACKYYAQDFGGYYNGACNNSDLIPVEAVGRGGADRAVNPESCRTYALKSIMYPTGGSLIFDWESNDIGFINNGRVTENSDGVHYSTTETLTLCAITEPGWQNLEINHLAVGSGSHLTVDLTQYFKMNPQLLQLTTM